MTTAEGPLLCLPYTWEINDVPMWAVQGQSSDELVKRLSATLAVLEREARAEPACAFDRPPSSHRRRSAPRLLPGEGARLLMSRADTIFVTSSQIADWFVAADKTGLRELEVAVRAGPK